MYLGIRFKNKIIKVNENKQLQLTNDKKIKCVNCIKYFFQFTRHMLCIKSFKIIFINYFNLLNNFYTLA